MRQLIDSIYRQNFNRVISTITYTHGRSVYLSQIGLYDLLWDQYHRNKFLWWRQSSQTCHQNFESTGMFRVQNHIVHFDKLSRLIHLMCRPPCSLHCNHTETSWGCSHLVHIWKRKDVTLVSSLRPGGDLHWGKRRKRKIGKRSQPSSSLGKGKGGSCFPFSSPPHRLVYIQVYSIRGKLICMKHT